jgi:2',3'-cyclic-nucleotide 2'-phosphodiesterase (5'-nucleotidase family)
MRKIIILCTLYIVPLFFLVSCHKQQQVSFVTTEAIPVNASLDGIQDTEYLAQLAPIKAGMEKEMSVQLGYAQEDLCVAAPECPMLNWATDALWAAAKKVYPGKVDIAVVNMGGMRCEWPAGPVTRSSVFELMPFDNRLVVLTLKGSDIRELCQSFATYGGQGVAGMSVKAKNGQLLDVKIAGKPVQPKALYTVATSDYLSGGTDHMEALTHYVDYWNSDLLIRELYLQAVMNLDTIRAAVDGRMDIQP